MPVLILDDGRSLAESNAGGGPGGTRRDGAPSDRSHPSRRERCTIADLALYAYTHRAHHGGFDLSGLPAVSAWLGRVAAEPGRVTIAP
ncbi:MAG: hypothetical protein ACR2H2_11500 [Solirubrobacteraceae bacterium]